MTLHQKTCHIHDSNPSVLINELTTTFCEYSNSKAIITTDLGINKIEN